MASKAQAQYGGHPPGKAGATWSWRVHTTDSSLQEEQQTRSTPLAVDTPPLPPTQRWHARGRAAVD
eukprot:4185988-Pyramimonas_sp.AAC.1